MRGTRFGGSVVREAAPRHVCQGAFAWSTDEPYRYGEKTTWEDATTTQREEMRMCITKSRTAWMAESDPVAYRARMDPGGAS
jgi:hypothetical protein